MLQNIAVVILNGFTPFELGVLCEVFGVDRTDDGLPAYDFAVVSGETVTGAGKPAAAHLLGGLHRVHALRPGPAAGG